MKSIRWSLVSYFLLLALVALGAATWIVYREAAARMLAERDANRAALLEQHRSRLRETKDKLDAQLLSHARTLASLARAQTQMQRAELAQYMPLGLLTATVESQGQLLAPLWAASGQRQLNMSIVRRIVREIKVDEDHVPRDTDFSSAEYMQINSEWGETWKSRSLGGKELTFERASLQGSQVVVETFDDVELPSGSIGRRVTAKYPITQYRFVRDPTPERPAGPPPERPQTPPAPWPNTGPGPRIGGQRFFPDINSAWFVVQCACETDRRDAEVARLAARLGTEARELDEAGDEALLQLRTRLSLIGLVTFVAAALGGFLIVGFGLAPLHRLSEAVSQVTAKDFHLPLAHKGLPTELEPIADRLQVTLDQLRAAFDREKQAVADISHELRTPVTALLATLDVVLRKTRSADEYRTALIEARNVGGHLRHLVERLLALARIDAGVVRVEAGPVEVASLVEQSFSLLRPLATEKNVSLATKIPIDLLWPTDADKLQDMLVNLLHNAVQYNRLGGSITVTAQVVETNLEIAVADTGIGMSPETQAQIFERFFRADMAREEAALHAGLGLSIVRGYAELLGGSVTVASELGKGTTFTLRLPALGEVPHLDAVCEWPRDGAKQEESAGRELLEV